MPIVRHEPRTLHFILNELGESCMVGFSIVIEVETICARVVRRIAVDDCLLRERAKTTRKEDFCVLRRHRHPGSMCRNCFHSLDELSAWKPCIDLPLSVLFKSSDHSSSEHAGPVAAV